MSIQLLPYHPDFDDKTVIWLQNEEIRKEFGFMGEISLSSHKQWINDQYDLIFFGICESLTGYHVGNLLLHQFESDLNGRYLQIYIGDKDCQGKGYGKQAMNLALKYCLDNKVCKAIYLHVFSDNFRAKQLYENLKFAKLGIESYQSKNSPKPRKQILYVKKLYE